MSQLRILCLAFALITFIGCGGDEPAEVTATVNRTQNTADPGIQRLNEQIAANPTQADLYASRAQMWYDKNSFDNAVADLQSALMLDSNNIGYHYLLTDVYLDYFQSRLALKTIDRAVSLDPDNLESLLTQAEVLLIVKQYERALETLNEVTRIDRRNPDAYLLLGQTFAETGDTTRAINATQEAIEIDPDLIDGWIFLGQLYAKMQDERAEQYFTTALSVDPNDVTAIHAKADYLRDQNQLSEAIALYKRTSEIDRQYVAGHFNAGLLYMELDSVEQAQREFTITLKNDPIHVRAYFFRGYSYELQGNTDAAREDYKTALRFAPDYELAQQGLARVGEG